jgi:arabinogalactan oligomer/maltooligosaccharide transport system substrate-binding protein
MPRLILALLALVSISLTACSLLSSGEEGTPAPPTASARPTPIGTPAETSTPGAGTATETPEEEGPLPLVLWTTEDYAPTSETEGGMQLLEQIQAFQEVYDMRVDVALKKRSGTGGLLDFLTTTSTAAPSVLPDIITLSDADLYRAAQAGLLQPLDDFVSSELLDDQFGFARALTRMGEATMGVLYQADLDHLVYDSASVDEPPLTWEDVYTSTVPFVFSPAAPADSINDPILIQYLAFGGALTDNAGKPALDPVQLAQALTFFREGREAGVIPRSVLDLSDATTAWATFRIGEAGMTQVPASLYLAERAGLSSAGFSTVPLFEPAVATIGHGWALAMVTQDPERQRLAAALIEHLLAPENSGAWTQAVDRLPTRNAALGTWDQNDAYVPFVRELLTQAKPAASPDVAAAVSGPLSQALADVLRLIATPDEAAQAAAEAIRAGQ